MSDDEYDDDYSNEEESDDGPRPVWNCGPPSRSVPAINAAPANNASNPAPANNASNAAPSNKSAEAVTEAFRSGQIPFRINHLLCPFVATYTSGNQWAQWR